MTTPLASNSTGRHDHPAATREHIGPSRPRDARFLVLVDGDGDLHERVAALLIPLVAQRRISAWRHDPRYPVRRLASYTDAYLPVPAVRVRGWIDSRGFLTPQAWPADGTVPAFFRANLRSEIGPKTGYEYSARVTAAWIRRPALTCYCGHHLTDHPYRDCAGHDRSGLLCDCTDYRPAHVPAPVNRGAIA